MRVGAFGQSGLDLIARANASIVLANLAALEAGLSEFWVGPPNGIDDTATIQAQVTAATAAGGGTVVLACGVYRLSAPITLPRDMAIGFRGQGGVGYPWAGATVVQAISPVTSLISGTAVGSNLPRPFFKDIHFDGNNLAQYGLSLPQVTRFKVRDCQFTNCTTACISTSRSWSWFISYSVFSPSPGGIGVLIGDGCTIWTIEQCAFEGGLCAISAESGTCCTIERNTIEGQTGVALDFTTGEIHALNINHNYLEQYPDIPVALLGSSVAAILGFSFIGNQCGTNGNYGIDDNVLTLGGTSKMNGVVAGNYIGPEFKHVIKNANPYNACVYFGNYLSVPTLTLDTNSWEGFHFAVDHDGRVQTTNTYTQNTTFESVLCVRPTGGQMAWVCQAVGDLNPRMYLLANGALYGGGNGTTVPVVVIGSDGSIRPPTISDSAAANSSTYYSSTQNKLVYKDINGQVNPLY